MILELMCLVVSLEDTNAGNPAERGKETAESTKTDRPRRETSIGEVCWGHSWWWREWGWTRLGARRGPMLEILNLFFLIL